MLKLITKLIINFEQLFKKKRIDKIEKIEKQKIKLELKKKKFKE